MGRGGKKTSKKGNTTARQRTCSRSHIEWNEPTTKQNTLFFPQTPSCESAREDNANNKFEEDENEKKENEREGEMGKRNRASFSHFNNNKNLLFLSFARSRSRDCRQAIDASRCNLFIISLLAVALLVLYGVVVVCGTT